MIKRFNDFKASENPLPPPLFQGLGYAALGFNGELRDNYKGLLKSSCLPPNERIRRAIGILETALQLDPDSRLFAMVGDGRGDDPDEKTSRLFLRHALREGKIMEDESDYRFHEVFRMLGWIGLQHCSDWLPHFESVCALHRDDPESLVREGRDILRDALFGREPSDQVQTAHE